MKIYTYNEVACECGEIAYKLGRDMKRWGRIDVTQTKEKYLTVRCYLSFHISLHSLIYPGYVYSQFHRWFVPISNVMDNIFSKIGLYYLISRYQMWLYRKLYYFHTKHLDPKRIQTDKLEHKQYYLTREDVFWSADYEELLK